MKKRMISLLIVFSLLVSAMIPMAGAIAIDQDPPAVSLDDELLSELYDQILFMSSAQTLSMADSYYLGDPIAAYEYIDDALVPVSYELYPVFSNGEIVYLATKTVDTDGSAHIQLSQPFTLLGILNAYADTASAVALLYDAEVCYFIADNDVVTVSRHEALENRSSFASEESVLASAYQLNSLHGISSSNTVIVATDHADTLANARASASLNVDYVSQLISGYSSYICWAASVACIGNFVTGGSYTARQIAEYRYYLEHGYESGAISDWNIRASFSVAKQVMSSVYNITMNYYSTTVSNRDTRIYNDIALNHPVFSIWDWSVKKSDGTVVTGSHACVIRGINTGSYVLVMDPEFGFAVAYLNANNTYAYTSSYSSTYLPLSSFGAA